MNNIVKIRLHGRGGQGTVTAAELLAVAAFHDGKHAQAFPNFGVERRGAPVMAYCRIADKPIRLREQIYFPDYVIIQDAGLASADPQILAGVEKAKGVLINSEKTAFPAIKNKNVITVPATKIALAKIGRPFINTAMLGAFVAMSGLISLESLEKTIKERFSNSIALDNVYAMKEAYDFVKSPKHKIQSSK